MIGKRKYAISGFKTSDHAEDQGLGRRKRAAYKQHVSILKRSITQIFGAICGFEATSRSCFRLLLLGGLCCLWSCQFIHLSKQAETGESGEHQLSSALAVYRSGNYEKAEGLFNEVLISTRDENIARQALYGLACAQLMRADSSARYREAYGLWQTWYGLPAQIPPWEDPRLLGPVFDKLLFPGRERLNPPDHAALTGSNDEPLPPAYPPGSGATSADAMMTPEKKDLYRSLIQIKDEENQRLKSRLEELEKENQSLKQQLKAIEEIHQEINQKKKGIQQP